MKTLAFGEILWDIVGDKKYIGGAPFNVAAHFSKMGVDSAILSALGNDELGREALAVAKNFNLNTDYINMEMVYPTGVVDVKVSNAGIPSYTINENTAWDNIALDASTLFKMKKSNWDVLCFGTLAQRTELNRKNLSDILDNIKFRHVFYDVNLRQKYFEKSWIIKSLEAASIVKVNDEESDFLSEYLFGSKMSELLFAEKLAKDYGTEIVCVTRGKKGCAVLYKNEFLSFPAEEIKVADTIGAGDSFSAAFLFAYLSGNNPFEAAVFASKMGSYVASQHGAVPEYSESLLHEIKAIADSSNAINAK